MAVELRLTLALEYRTFRHMANCRQISKTEINRAVLWVENVLNESAEFALLDIKERFSDKKEDEDESEDEAEILLIDATEQPIERPKYEQEKSYSGKKMPRDKISNISRCEKQGDIECIWRYRRNV